MSPKYGDVFNFEFFQNSYIHCLLTRANSNFCKTDVYFDAKFIFLKISLSMKI